MNYTFYALSNASKMLAALLPNADDRNVIAPESMVAKAANAAGWGYLVNGQSEQFSHHVAQCPSPPFSGYPPLPDTDAGVPNEATPLNEVALGA
ncbi:MAG: hypothetical protein CMF39_03375 [Legionellaceae bacterium]|nr:hypothetical protein [Legionellaceae bacterium]|tara:strand:- start:334 stop:615 length:282 start_codon:yes stop_codon:yes gene_type:complete